MIQIIITPCNAFESTPIFMRRIKEISCGIKERKEFILFVGYYCCW
jgi:hypothetical protein